MTLICATILLGVLVESVHPLHYLNTEWCGFTFLSFRSLTAGVLRFWRLHWRLALVPLELVLFCYSVGTAHPGWLCSEVAVPFGAVYSFSSMYQDESGSGTLEMSEETSMPPITVAKRYRRQPLHSGAEDSTGSTEQSVVGDIPLLSASAIAPHSAPAAQSDSQVVSTPAPACSPLQSLDDLLEPIAADAADDKPDSPTKPGSTASQEFLSATEPFSVVLGDETFSVVHSLGRMSAGSSNSVPLAPMVQAGSAHLIDAFVQTLSSLPCKRTAWDLGRSSSRPVSKARHGLPAGGVPSPKPVHVLRNTTRTHPGLPRPRPVPSKRGTYAAYPSLQCGISASGLVTKASAASRSSVASEDTHATLVSNSAVPSFTGSVHLASILQRSSSKAPAVCTSSQVHARNWAKALRLWKDLCITLVSASSCLPDIFASPNCDKLLEKLLCKISDTTALRYISSAVKMVSALQDLDLPLEAPSQVQLIDSWLAAQKEAGKDTSLHSENALKALRWLKQTAALHYWPDLYQALFATGAWKQVSPRKESIPLPLAFVVWLETRILMDAFDVSTTVFAGTVLLCIWGSLRFSDVQHVVWSDSILDDTSFRASSYRTKTSRFMPFGVHCGGFYQRPASQSWVLRWLQAFESIAIEHLQSSSPPDFGFMRVEAGSLSPLSYCSTLAALRSLLSSWGGISEEQVLLYTLHSMKATFLSFYRQCGCSQEVRHLQGHHKFQQSMHLYGRDDVSPCIAEHGIFVDKVRGGWRPRTPLMRGVHFVMNEPAVVFADSSHFWSLTVDLHFFKVHFSEAPAALPTQVIPASIPTQMEAIDGAEILESDSSGSEPDQPDEVNLCMAETSSIAHALVEGAPACGCRGCFRAVDSLPSGARLCKHKSCLAVFATLC